MLSPKASQNKTRDQAENRNRGQGHRQYPKTKDHIGKGASLSAERDLAKFAVFLGTSIAASWSLPAQLPFLGPLNRIFLRLINLLKSLIPAEDSTSTTCPSFSSSNPS